MVKETHLLIGLSSKNYGTHFFRRGGASFALEDGITLGVTSIMGDWKSGAVYLYLHMPLSQRVLPSSKQRHIYHPIPPTLSPILHYPFGFWTY